MYCGHVGAITRDHIPPQNLFPSPRPSDLITVPSCQNCNKGFELDDEYFRLAIATGIDGLRFPKVLDLSIQAINKLQQPSKFKFAKSMLASFRKKPVYTPGGLYLGHRGALEIDRARIVDTVRRVIRGLFFHHLETRLRLETAVWVWSDWFVEDGDADPEFLISVKQVFEFLCTLPLHVVGDGIFRYRYAIDDEDQGGSAWWLSFYEHRNFIAGTSAL